jgi:phosphoglycerate dehydrogenase-like enzyme
MLDSLDGWFINVGRGNAVSEDDILAAIDGGGLLGAGLDVFENEPLPAESPLWTNPRVVITPHTAGLSPHYGRRLAEIFADNLEALSGRGEWRNRIV